MSTENITISTVNHAPHLCATVKVPGTCGELVQGKINGLPFLITCPINLYSYVSLQSNNNEIKFPTEKWKAKLALQKILNFFQLRNFPCNVEINSEIPISKGMASSTADIVGVCKAVAKLLNKEISPEKIAKIALSIEPSDGVMFDGIVLFDYLNGSIIEHLGFAPEMKILAIDTGGTVDTIEFNKRDYSKIRLSQEKEIKKAVELVKEGIKEKNCYLIGEGATISAILNQEILFKEELEDIIKLTKEFNAYGVCVAHSGTIIGILLPIEFTEMSLLKKSITAKLKKQYKFYNLQTI